MEFKLNFEIPRSKVEINHHTPVIFLGSCFSDEMFEKARYHGWNVLSNPFGTIYHPEVLSRFVLESINIPKTERIFNRGELYFSWDASSLICGETKEETFDLLQKNREAFKSQVRKAKVIFITFGTAWKYTLNESNEVVANCHKIPSSEFKKSISESASICRMWQNTIDTLKSINPSLEIIFTVSPVRHIKDGLIENNQSKAVLFEVIRQLQADKNCSYFPSFEILVDELRDYRFYKEDKVHPSKEAVSYVWERLVETYCNSSTIQLNKKVSLLRREFAHKSLHPTSKETQLFKTKALSKLEQLRKEHPEINW